MQFQNKNETFGRGNDESSTFCRYFVKLFKKLYKMDKIKRLEPLYSNDLSNLAMFIMTNKDDLITPSKENSTVAASKCYSNNQVGLEQDSNISSEISAFETFGTRE